MQIPRRPLLPTATVRAAFGDNNATIAQAVGCTRQAVALWGRFVPELMARRILDGRPELQACVKWARIKRIRKPRS